MGDKNKINSNGNTFGSPQAKCDSISDFGFSDLDCDLNMDLELDLKCGVWGELAVITIILPICTRSDIKSKDHEFGGSGHHQSCSPDWCLVAWGALVGASNRVSCIQDHTYLVLTTNESISASVVSRCHCPGKDLLKVPGRRDPAIYENVKKLAQFLNVYWPARLLSPSLKKSSASREGQIVE